MIGENIKALRKTHDLTQPEFAKIVGISRNSLSRYENGTSSVSTELIDRICQKFNVSYIDIVGEEKLLTPVEDYQLTLKIEVIKERGANILAQLYRLQDELEIAFDDANNQMQFLVHLENDKVALDIRPSFFNHFNFQG